MIPLCIDTHVMERNSKLRERKLLDMDLCKIENEKVTINLKSEREDKLVQTMPALMSKGTIVVLLQCGSSPFKFRSFSIKFRIWNNSSSSDVLYIQASISISPKYESK